MLLQTWTGVLTQSFQDLWIGIVNFVPNLIIAALIFIVGWIIGAVLGRVIAQVIKSLKVDHALASAGVDDVVSQAGFKLDVGAFL